MFSYRALRSLVSKNRPPQGTYQYGELYVNLADEQLGVIDENGIPQDLLAITFFKNLAHYSEGDHVIYQGKIYIAKNDIQGPKNFDPDDWSTSGIDLSLADYDEELPYSKGHVAFFPGDNCFLQAAVDIPANTPFDEAMWEPICSGKGGTGSGGGYAVGDIVPLFQELTVDQQEERQLVPLLGQELNRVGAYADLFAVYGDQFGGNGSTTFRVPNMQGRVMRGMDPAGAVDPDGPGRAGGSSQWDAVRMHDHPNHGETLKVYGYWPTSSSKLASGSSLGWSGFTYGVGGKGGTATESRMRNVAVHWYAKY